MKMNTRGLLSVGAMILALAGTSVADEVILIPNSTFKVPGNRVRGNIDAETPNVVKIQPTAGAAQEIPVDQIASVSYSGQPPMMQLAETSESQGNVAEAIDRYKRAASEASSLPLAAQAAQFGAARALAGLALASPNKADEAIKALEAFLKAHPKSRHQGPALELIARLSLAQGASAKGAVARADSALNDLAAIPWAADRAAILKTRVLAKKGQNDEAVKQLDAIIASAPKGSRKAVEAQLARAESLVALKKFPDAEASVKGVIKEIPVEAADLQAQANNTLGDCLRAAGQPKNALKAYLRTDILFDKDKEEHARALSQIAQIWRELKRDDRADEVVERLKQQYPQSPWLVRASAR
jgi:tetratricopeptide (TPR) repeat protein